MQKKNIFSHFFLITCPQVHHLQSKKCNFLLKFCVKMLFCRHYFSPLNIFMRKGTDLEPELEPDTHLWLMMRIRIREAQKHADPDPDPQHWFSACKDLREAKNLAHLKFGHFNGHKQADIRCLLFNFFHRYPDPAIISLFLCINKLVYT
jgi:hypothetical protein